MIHPPWIAEIFSATLLFVCEESAFQNSGLHCNSIQRILVDFAGLEYHVTFVTQYKFFTSCCIFILFRTASFFPVQDGIQLQDDHFSYTHT